MQAPLALSPTPAQVNAKANFNLQASIVTADAALVATAKDAAAALAIVISASPATLAEKAAQLLVAQNAVALTKISLAAALKEQADVNVLIADAKAESKPGSAIDLPAAQAAATAAADVTAAQAAIVAAKNNLNIATSSIVVGNTFTLDKSPTTAGAEAVYLADAALLAEDAVAATLGNINAQALLNAALLDPLTTVAQATKAVADAQLAVNAANAAMALTAIEKAEARTALADAASVLALAATASNLLNTELAAANAQVVAATDASTSATVDSGAAAALLAAATAQLLVAQAALIAVTGTTYTVNAVGATCANYIQVGAGNVILNDLQAGAGDYTLTIPAYSSIAATSLTINGAAGVIADLTDARLSTVAAATINAIGIADVSGTATQALTVNDSAQDALILTVNGGASATVNTTEHVASAGTGGQINVGPVTAVGTGAANITSTLVSTNVTDATSAQAGDMTVTGGSTVIVTQNITSTAATIAAVKADATVGGITVNTTGGAININGTANTTTVVVNQSAAVTAVATASANVIGVNNGDVRIIDVNYAYPANTKAGTITSVTVNGSSANSAIKDNNALATLTLAGTNLGLGIADVGQVISGVTAYKTTLSVNANATTSTVTDNTVKIVNLVTGGTAASSLRLTAGALTNYNVSGTKNVTLTGTAAPTITVSGAASVTTALVAGQVFTSTSTGTDIISIAAPVTTALVGNSTTAEEIIWTAGGIVSTLFGTGGSITGFNLLGVSGASTTVALSPTNTFTGLDVTGQTADTTTTFTGVTAGTALSIDTQFAGYTSAGQAVVYTTADTAGLTDSVAVKLGGANNATALTIVALTLQDKLNNGIGKVTIISNDSVAAGVNTISSLYDSGLSTLSVVGNARLAISGSPLDLITAALTINANDTGTAGFTLSSLRGNGDSALNSVVITGSNTTTTIISLAMTGTTFTVTDSANAAVSIANLADNNAETESFSNTGTSTLTIGASSHRAQSVANLTLTGKVAYTAADDLVTTGITVNAATDNADVFLHITGGATVPGAGSTLVTPTDRFILGNGANTINDGGTGNITVVMGINAALTLDYVKLGATAATATHSVTIGNGLHYVGLGNGDLGSTQTVTVGTGGGNTTSLTVATIKSFTNGNLTITSTDVAASSEYVIHNPSSPGPTGTTVINLGNGTDRVDDTGAGNVSVTVGSGSNVINLGVGTYASTQTVNVGSGGGSVTSSTNGNINITSTDVAADTQTVSVTSNVHAATITLGNGTNTVTTGATNGPVTISVGTHTGLVDNFYIGYNNVGAQSISGAATGDVLHFGASASNFFQGGQVASAINSFTVVNPTLLSSWFAAAETAALTAHGAVEWFQFRGNTYEVAVSTTLSGGSLFSHETVIELIGLHNVGASLLTSSSSANTLILSVA